MGIILRPRFGGIPSGGYGNDTGDKAPPVSVMGTVGGHRVVVLRANDPGLGDVRQVILVPRAGTEATAISVHPADAAGEADATMAAIAVLQALAVIEDARSDPT